MKKVLLPILLLAVALAFLAQRQKSSAVPAVSDAPHPAAQTPKLIRGASSASSKSAAPPSSPSPPDFIPIDFSRLTDRYAMPATTDPDTDRAGQEARLQAIFARLKPTVERGRNWQAKMVLPGKGGPIPVTLLALLYDGLDRENPFPLRTLREPKFLSWILVGFFSVDNELIKWSMSSSLENTATRNGKDFLFMSFAPKDSLAGRLDYLVVPAPGESAVGEVLLPGEKDWRPLTQPVWRPLGESEYRRVMETFQHDAQD